MSKLVKVILSIAAVGAILFTGAIYYASTQINPKEIKALAVENLEKIFPNSIVKIGKIDYSLGTSVKVSVEKLNLKLKKGKIPLLDIGEVAVKIPLLAMLTGGGSVEILANTPKIHFISMKNKSNWENALGNKKLKASSQKSDKTSGKIKIPDFIKKSKVNFKLKNLDFFLIDKMKKTSKFAVTKIVAKDINLDKSTAFEIHSKIKYQIETKKFFNTEIRVVGEVKLGDFVEKSKIKASISMAISGTSIDGLGVDIPNIKGKLNVNGDLKKINTEIDISVGSLVTVTANTELNILREKLKAKNINITLYPAELSGLIPENFKKAFAQLSLDNSKIKIEGSVGVDLKTSKLMPKLKISTPKGLGVNFIQEMPIVSIVTGSVVGHKVRLKVLNKLMNGSASAEIFTTIDPLNIPSDISKLKPITVNLNVRNTEFTKAFLQKTLYAKGKAKAKKGKVVASDNTPGSKVSLPKVIVNISGRNITVGTQQVSLKGKINIEGKKILAKPLKLTYGQGVVKINFDSLIKNTKNISNNFSVNFYKVNVTAFNAFFPPFLKDLKGTFNGAVVGKLNLAKAMTYNVKVDLKGTNGELKNLDLNQFIMPIISKVSFLKGKIDPKSLNITDKFELIDTKVLATEKIVKLKKLVIVGNKKESKISADGYISMQDKKSKVKGNLYLKKLAKQLKPITGQTNVAFLLKGDGFILIPDALYTSERLVKGAAQVEIKKQTKKVKKKLENKLKSEAKKLLKGFKF